MFSVAFLPPEFLPGTPRILFWTNDGAVSIAFQASNGRDFSERVVNKEQQPGVCYEPGEKLVGVG